MLRRTFLALLAAAASGRAMALYDPGPNGALALAPGGWTGALTYRDWSNPDKLVTLPCTLAVALAAPNELVLYYVFNDGPGKTVYGYDRMTFDFGGATLVWTSGTAKPNVSQYRLTAVTDNVDGARVLFERKVDARLDKYTFELTRRTWSLAKVEVGAADAEVFRNKYELTRNP